MSSTKNNDNLSKSSFTPEEEAIIQKAVEDAKAKERAIAIQEEINNRIAVERGLVSC